jgi:hypothetical protein
MYPSITIGLNYSLKKTINILGHCVLSSLDAIEGDNHTALKWNEREAKK